MRPTIPLVLLATTLLATAALGAAQTAGGKAEVREEKDKIVLQNEDVTVWFQGKKPMLKIFSADAGANNTTAAFAFKFHRLVEYRDLDANQVPDAREILASLNLEKASAWEVQTTRDNGSVVLNLTLEAPVKVAGGVLDAQNLTLPDRDARVSLVFRIGEQALAVDAGDENLTVPTTAIKYDLIVETWPTVDKTDGRLALEAIVTGDLEAQDVLGVSGAAVQGNGTEVGVLAWTRTAQGVTSGGEQVDVPVVTQIAAADAEAEAEGNETRTRLVHTFDAADLASLVYDPVIGTASTGAGPGGVGDDVQDAVDAVPGAGLLLVAAAVAGVALLARRR